MTDNNKIIEWARDDGLEDARVIVWFSCGAASACALKFALEKYGRDKVHAVYCDTSKNEHADNKRFIKDVEAWLDIEVERIKSKKYKTVEHVAGKTGYMAGVNGARCTVELKKAPRFKFQKPDDVHVFGFTFDEKDAKRAKNFIENNHDISLDMILVKNRVTKMDCFHIVMGAGIALPELYLMGYPNNNCIGCFKATGAAYWNKVRVDFPKVFNRRCRQSRMLGVRLTRFKGERIFLDELPEWYMKGKKITEDLSCGPQCGQQNLFDAAGDANEQ